MSARDARQRVAGAWCHAAFGSERATSLGQRAARIVEEAAELAQALGLSRAAAVHVVDHVYRQPVGEVNQEIGGVQLTVIALCDTLGVSADDLEEQELQRVLAKPIDHFRARQAKKDAAGLGYEPQHQADSYVTAFYEIAHLLGFHAMPLSPKDGFEQFIKPKLELLVSAEGSKAALDARQLEIVPGAMRCPKCNFALQRQTLYMGSGTVGPGDNHTEPCPNGCGPLWPQTWRDEAQQLGERLVAKHEELTRAETLIARLHREGVLSEGQCCKALGMDRVAFRTMVDWRVPPLEETKS